MKDVVEVDFEAVGPDMTVSSRVDELGHRVEEMKMAIPIRTAVSRTSQTRHA